MDLPLQETEKINSIVTTERRKAAMVFAPTAAEGYELCERITRAHYENFPVASLLLPRAKRKHVCAIYAFARTADDFADEGMLTPAERLHELNVWENKFDDCLRGNATDPIFAALGETVETLKLPHQLFRDLLNAFRMDVTTTRFATFSDVTRYCSLSANPVGRLVLHTMSEATEKKLAYSDSICTGLQLANFWQDVAVDWTRGRVYIPQEDCMRFGYNDSDFGSSVCDERFRRLIQFQIDRTRKLFEAGKPLLAAAGSSLKLESTLTWLGGMSILDAIERQNYDVFSKRPVISTARKLGIFLRALWMMIV